MERFEFVIEGPAVSLRAKKTNTRRYQKWIRKVRAAAREQWPEGLAPSNSQNITVAIVNYYTLAPPDVDNIIKPILDGLETVAYSNDQQVHRVISEKLDRSNVARLGDPSALVMTALENYTEVLHIMVYWNPED
ncbi:MAG TPA: RusA family crossover junction endodeoxyribonuclease [Blastocatellia bacterium]|nr:RusA family crossover junction endodeoxyribonuclease [Blastocatellia bacterium]